MNDLSEDAGASEALLQVKGVSRDLRAPTSSARHTNTHTTHIHTHAHRHSASTLKPLTWHVLAEYRLGLWKHACSTDQGCQHVHAGRLHARRTRAMQAWPGFTHARQTNESPKAPN